ncbi:MAG TPA: hypothetical protein VGM87_23270 [Roseomonas sp.]|jgi:hypothetical protein
MSRRRFLRAAIAPVLLAPIVAACRQAPLVAVSGAEFASSGSLVQRAEQIRRAGLGLGWTMQEARPGMIRGTLNLRSHQAVVDIAYDTQRFTIAYVDSTNLNHSGDMIHPNYNGWVQRLQNAIVAQSS